MEAPEKRSPPLNWGKPCLGCKHLLKRSVYQYAQILNTSGRVEVRLLPADNAQVPAQLENKIPMLQKNGQ